MLLDIAPWIVESWHEFALALSFDVPNLAPSKPIAEAVVAGVALLLLTLAWQAAHPMPLRAKVAARALALASLLLPVAIAADSHKEAVIAAWTAKPHQAVRDRDFAARMPAAGENLRSQPGAAPGSQINQPSEPANAQHALVDAQPSATSSGPVPSTAPSPPAQADARSAGTRAMASRVTATALRRLTQTLARALPPPAPLVPSVTVFYGTDRAVRSGDGPLDYTAARAERLEIGRAGVTLPAEGRTTITALNVLPADAVLEQARLHLARAEHNPQQALVFVPGYNTSFEASLTRTAQLVRDLAFDGPAFVYSWPSAGRVAQYGYDVDSAMQAVPHLQEFLRLVLADAGTASVTLIAHGLGARVTLDALAGLKSQLARAPIGALILAAPDMDRAAFASRVAAVSPLAARITLYAAASDRGLNISRRYTGAVERAGDVYGSGPLLLTGVETVDASTPGTDILSLNHAGLAAPSALAADIAAVIAGPRNAASSGPALESVNTPAGRYYKFSDHVPRMN